MMEKSQPHCRWKIMKKLIKTKTDEEIAAKKKRFLLKFLKNLCQQA